MKNNKKAFVGGTIYASAGLFVILMVIVLCSFILYTFNDELQKNSIVSEMAKETSSEAYAKFPPILGYMFLASFIGFFIYTMITAFAINSMHPIFWILGFVIVLLSTIISSIIKLIFGAFTDIEIFAPFVANIPGALWYIQGLEIINIVWLGLQLTIVYVKYEGF